MQTQHLQMLGQALKITGRAFMQMVFSWTFWEILVRPSRAKRIEWLLWMFVCRGGGNVHQRIWQFRRFVRRARLVVFLGMISIVSIAVTLSGMTCRGVNREATRVPAAVAVTMSEDVTGDAAGTVVNVYPESIRW